MPIYALLSYVTDGHGDDAILPHAAGQQLSRSAPRHKAVDSRYPAYAPGSGVAASRSAMMTLISADMSRARRIYATSRAFDGHITSGVLM